MLQVTCPLALRLRGRFDKVTSANPEDITG